MITKIQVSGTRYYASWWHINLHMEKIQIFMFDHKQKNFTFLTEVKMVEFYLTEIAD